MKLLNKRFVVLFFALAVACASLCAQQKLSSAASSKVSAALFEVVVKKPAEGAITYESELPLALVNPAIRNDPYLLLGSAFLMSDGRFYSAAHIFNLLEKTLYTDYFIRDQKGTVYPIDTVDRFSIQYDFISFSSQSYTEAAKTTNAKAAGLSKGDVASGAQVFAAGHLTGEGRNITGGTTSSVKFDDGGTFQRVFFSLSDEAETVGGPLLNANAEVAGIITSINLSGRKGEALLFEEAALFPANTGDAYRDFPYSLPNVKNLSFNHKFAYEIKLPLSLTELQKTLSGKYSAYVENIVTGLKKYLGINSTKGFLHGSGSAEILCSGTVPVFPYTITYSEKGKWSFYCPQDLGEELLPDHGSLIIGTMHGYTQALLTKPDTVSFETLFSTPKVYMDYLLSALGMSRVVGGHSICITSFGEPYRSSIYKDAQSRTWKIHYWQLPFANSMAVTFSLLLPQGMYIIMDFGTTGPIMSTSAASLKFVADCTYPRYAATVKDWKGYFEICRRYNLLYAPFSGMLLTQTASQFRFSSSCFELNIPSNVMAIDETAMLCTSIGYTAKTNGFSAENRAIDLYINAGKQNYAYMYLSKNPKPLDSASKATRDLWEKKRNKVFPYTGKPYNQETYTYFDEVLFPASAANNKDITTLFVFACELYGAERTEDMKKFTDSLRSAFVLK